eukprot:288397_1
MSYKNKRIKQWSNKDVITWIQSIGLSDKWMNIMVGAITETKCVGQDFMTIKSPKDITDSFDIKIPILSNRVFNEIQKMKKYEINKVMSAAAGQFSYLGSNYNDEKKTNSDEFRLQLYGDGKFWTVPNASAKTAIRRAKELYKAETGCCSNIDDINFVLHGQRLNNNKTLHEYGIMDENHLIIVFLSLRST